MRPALRPISKMAGATNPTISKGMMNPRNSLKTELNVANILASHRGAMKPTPMPKAMAIRTLGSRPR